MTSGAGHAKARETKSRTLWRCAVLTALLAVLTACGTVDIPLPYRDRVTEGTKIYKKFFTGRVLVTRVVRPVFRKDAGYASAKYFLPDGTSLGCARLAGSTLTTRSRWDIEPNGPVYAALRTWGWRAERGRGTKGFFPIRYNRKTGHIGIGTRLVRYVRVALTDGWIQNDFPGALKNACPDVALPPDLAINEKQTSLFLEEMRAQDPDAPIQNFPGTEKLKGRHFLGVIPLDD